jgi:radical SAM protein with 4Fe4S-binding SPASM domain
MSMQLEYYPSILQVETTSQCNLKCIMCPHRTMNVSTGAKQGHMNDDVWGKIFEIAQNVDNIILNGFGEVLLNPNFSKYLHDLDALGVRTSFSTNGIELKSPFVEQLNDIKNLVHINVSIDSPDADIYRGIRGIDLQYALSGLETLMKNIGRTEIVTVSSIAMNTNLKSLAKFPSILADFGVRKFIIQDLKTNWINEMSDENIINLTNLQENIKLIEMGFKKYNILLNLDSTLEKKFLHKDDEYLKPQLGNCCSDYRSKECTVPWLSSYINKDGKVLPCCNADKLDSTNEYIMGDIREQSFKEIWIGEKYNNFRNNFLDGRKIPLFCLNCNQPTVNNPHVLAQYSAELIEKESKLHVNLIPLLFSMLTGFIQLELTVKNTGLSTWTRDSMLKIGTSSPMDRDSVLFHHSWIGRNRICSFSEEIVSPGDIATFNLTVMPILSDNTEVFQLVIDGVGWLPNTKFEVKYQNKYVDFIARRVVSPICVYCHKHSAKIIKNYSILTGSSNLKLIVKNIGKFAWANNDRILIGTSSPKDRKSAFFHESWLSSNRICSFLEETVPPGSIATFDFMISPGSSNASEKFQLVIDGVCWLSGTEFVVTRK